MMSILERAVQVDHFRDHKGAVFFGVRTLADTFYLEPALALRRRLPRQSRRHRGPVRRSRANAVACRISGSEARERHGSRGRDEGHGGPAIDDAIVYIAGPPVMVDGAIRALIKGGVPTGTFAMTSSAETSGNVGGECAALAGDRGRRSRSARAMRVRSDQSGAMAGADREQLRRLAPRRSSASMLAFRAAERGLRHQAVRPRLGRRNAAAESAKCSFCEARQADAAHSSIRRSIRRRKSRLGCWSSFCIAGVDRTKFSKTSALQRFPA